MSQYVGIITYHNAINYGAVLQAYALSKQLHIMGIDCNILDYRCTAVDIQYKCRGRKNCSSWKNFIAHNLTCILRYNKKKNFKRFQKLLPLSTACDCRNLERITRKYSTFITGSDQVFNPVCNKSDPTYFLNFVKKGSKNAFSASMGSISQFESSSLDTLSMLSSFDSISMRETDAANYLSQKTGKQCAVTMDPIWLLNKNEWEKIATFNKRKPYILVYNLMDLAYMRKFAIELSKKTGLPIISVNRTIMGDATYILHSHLASNCSPSDFVGYIENAEYVVTDSFHGASFSILFGKKLFVGLNKEKDNTNSRLITILERAGLLNRIIDDQTISNFNATIYYEELYPRLTSSIESSKEYLKKICLIGETSV